METDHTAAQLARNIRQHHYLLIKWILVKTMCPAGNIILGNLYAKRKHNWVSICESPWDAAMSKHERQVEVKLLFQILIIDIVHGISDTIHLYKLSAICLTVLCSSKGGEAWTNTILWHTRSVTCYCRLDKFMYFCWSCGTEMRHSSSPMGVGPCWSSIVTCLVKLRSHHFKLFTI